MGKNYTLYIKHEEFADEPNKSGLINGLLGKLYEKRGREIDEKIEQFASVGIRSTVDVDIKQDVASGDASLIATVVPDPDDVARFKANQKAVLEGEPIYTSPEPTA